MADNNFDVIILGAGPGGYVTAIRAAQLGFKTTIVEKEHLGGICLNWGCIPTKALLRTAEIYDYIKHAADYGLKVDEPSFDLKKIIERSRTISKTLNAGVKQLLKKNNVNVIYGTGRLKGPGKVDVTETDGQLVLSLKAKHIIVATGSRPRTLPGLEPDGKLVWTYFEAMTPDIEQHLELLGAILAVILAILHRLLKKRKGRVSLLLTVSDTEENSSDCHPNTNSRTVDGVKTDSNDVKQQPTEQQGRR